MNVQVKLHKTIVKGASNTRWLVLYKSKFLFSVILPTQDSNTVGKTVVVPAIHLIPLTEAQRKRYIPNSKVFSLDSFLSSDKENKVWLAHSGAETQTLTLDWILNPMVDKKYTVLA